MYEEWLIGYRHQYIHIDQEIKVITYHFKPRKMNQDSEIFTEPYQASNGDS